MDHLKKSREKADISNKEGRCLKKPTKLKDYKDLDNLNLPPMKKPRLSMMNLGMILVLIQ